MDFLAQNWKLILIVIALCVASNLIGSGKSTKDKSSKITNFKGKYKKICVLTNNEKSKFRALQNVAKNLNLLIFAKVRLADIIQPIDNSGNKKTLFNKIQSKHVDFLLCNNNLETVCVIEIDDNSHEREDRKERDNFVDMILKDVGITTIRKRTVIESELSAEVKELLKKMY